MLIPVLAGLGMAPPPPPPPPPIFAPLSASVGGTWTVYQIGQGWIVETPIGTMKCLNPERIIQAARAARATIKWLD